MLVKYDYQVSKKISLARAIEICGDVSNYIATIYIQLMRVQHAHECVICILGAVDRGVNIEFIYSGSKSNNRLVNYFKNLANYNHEYNCNYIDNGNNKNNYKLHIEFAKSGPRRILLYPILCECIIDICPREVFSKAIDLSYSFLHNIAINTKITITYPRN